MQNWHIREYKEGDESKITNLLNSVFKLVLDLDHWNWKYRENPVGFKTYVAENREEIVAHYGLIYSKIKIGHQVIVGSQAVDAVTRSDYQGKGIFVDLGKVLLRAAGEDGVPLTYGFPNEVALPGHRKVGWVEVCTTPILVRPLNIKGLLKSYIKNDLLVKTISPFAEILFKILARDKKIHVKDLSASRVPSFDERVNRFWKKTAPHHSIIQVRDKDFLNWRYAKNPRKQYIILTADRNGDFVGYVVLRGLVEKSRKGGAIVDMLTLFDDGEIAEFLIAKAIQYFKAKRMDYIACLMRQGNIYHERLKKNGFITSTKRVRFIIHVNSGSSSKWSTVSLGRWFFTWGDTDFM